MPTKLQNIYTGEMWIRTDSESVKHRFIHESSIVFDIEFDGILGIWYFPAHGYNYSYEVHLIDEDPIPFKAYNIRFYSGIDVISKEQFSAIEKTIDIKASYFFNSNEHFNSFL